MKVTRRSANTCCETKAWCSCVLDEDDAARLVANGIEHEVGMLLNMYHPNVMRIEAYGCWHGVPCMIMPLAECCVFDLQQKAETCVPYLTLWAAIQLFNALTYLHDSCFVAHCDVSPRNILIMQLEPDFHIRLSDFGAARFIHPETGSILKDKSLIPSCCTTYPVASPQCYFTTGDKNIASKCDVWAAAMSILILGGLWRVHPFATPEDECFKQLFNANVPKKTKHDQLRPFLSSDRLTSIFIDKALVFHESNRASAKQCLEALISIWQC